MATYREFVYELNGLDFTVKVYWDAVANVFKADVAVTEGAADFNALYWGDDVADGAVFALAGKGAAPLNMNGANYLGATVDWDGGVKLSDPGLGREGMSKATYLTAGEAATFTLAGLVSLDAIDFLGVRATSTTTPEGSIKVVDEGEFRDDAPPDDFPLWPQDISNIVLYFEDTAGDTRPGGGDGYYTVKIDNWPGAGDDDLDNLIDDILAWLVANDPNIDAGTDLLGVAIKGGLETTQYFAYGDYNTNGTAADGIPAGAPTFAYPPTVGQVPGSAIDVSYDYGIVLA
jgi:hypothetical protein